MSTLCAGCGHDSVTASMARAFFDLSIEPHRAVKVSGIGCSSKTTAYFLREAHGNNTVHGRMPSVATGAAAANSQLTYIGVSGDGDTASIGLGQFCHAIRRRLNLVYIVENNGTYGLTKGQFSATNDKRSKNRRGVENLFEGIDLCALAIEMGAGFVARSFSGDKQQLVPLIKAAITYHGFALIDVISPCVTFNNHPTSTKSYDYVRDHNLMVDRIDFVPKRSEIKTQYEPGTSVELTLHDGSALRLYKLAEDYDPADRGASLARLDRYDRDGAVSTGLLYFDENQIDLHDLLATTDRPLNTASQADLCPGAGQLDAINNQYR